MGSRLLTLILLASLAHATPSPTAPPANPLQQFLNAADHNDFTAMQPLIAPNAAQLIPRIRNCYLRRVYRSEINGEMIAAWMCAEGANKSRVLLGSLAPAPQGKVRVTVVHEERNDRPAPRRAGSAFAPASSPR